jgi:FkbM family methyltransferase
MSAYNHPLNRLLPVRLRSALKRLALRCIPSTRHLDMPTRLRHMARLGFAPPVIFDVGAANGDWSRMAAGVWPASRVVAFEPNPADGPALNRTARDLPRFQYRRCFLGAQRKTITFAPLGAGTTALVGAPAGGTGERAEVLVLDELVRSGELPPPDLLKLDVQGYELEVLRGATEALRACQAVMAEVNLFRYAPETPLADEVIRFMREHGFVLYDVAGVLRRPLDDALGQMDLVFVREDHPLRKSRAWV